MTLLKNLVATAYVVDRVTGAIVSGGSEGVSAVPASYYLELVPTTYLLSDALATIHVWSIIEDQTEKVVKWVRTKMKRKSKPE